MLATNNLHLLPKLAAAFPQYGAAAAPHSAAAPQGGAAAETPQGGAAMAELPQGGQTLRPGEPVGEYMQYAAATEAAAALGLKVRMRADIVAPCAAPLVSARLFTLQAWCPATAFCQPLVLMRLHAEVRKFQQLW